ncbi:NUDIX hydrolase [Histoplasma capsulatum]|uniref:NUDIX hydrolase n=1 Tax=Ajellomyces capsulatus TaxID=5037 RepID=A0A8A1M1Y2_AJECA|nr:conserved hypothetical protein [Histoplasma mississippiense (nom. inval.)]EDN03043.1 conserved hypothetical protein [Histoplasma mississippiense (nom. inval.)]QSS58664.1 NUDIX hydrolase [Histoplasma capsulatum]
MSTPKPHRSYLDLVKECDSFPYIQDDPADYKAYVSNFHEFKINGYSQILGYMPDEIVEKFSWPEPTWKVVKGVEGQSGTITLMSPENVSPEERTTLINNTLQEARDTFEVLKGKGWRNEMYPIYVPGTNKLLASIERSAACLFGIPTWGIHMTAYVENADGTYMLWVPRRSMTKSTFKGMLDNSVAGGMATGERPFECMLREAEEEASLDEEVARNAISAGVLRYIYERDERAGGETGLLQPECEYIYDLKLPPDVILKPKDGEVERFTLMSVDDVIIELKQGNFKPNCAVVIIDFLIRHGILKPEDDNHYEEICSRLRRRIEYANI